MECQAHPRCLSRNLYACHLSPATKRCVRKTEKNEIKYEHTTLTVHIYIVILCVSYTFVYCVVYTSCLCAASFSRWHLWLRTGWRRLRAAEMSCERRQSRQRTTLASMMLFRAPTRALTIWPCGCQSNSHLPLQFNHFRLFAAWNWAHQKESSRSNHWKRHCAVSCVSDVEGVDRRHRGNEKSFAVCIEKE